MRSPVRAARLSAGDRVRLGGTALTVIGLSGTVARLADPAGVVTEMTLAGLMAREDFEHPGSPAALPPVSSLDGLPEDAVREALWWERHIVEVLRGLPPDAEPGTEPKPEYDPRLVSLTRREQAKAAELTATGRQVTASAVKQRRRRYQAGGLAAMADRRAAPRTPPWGRADQRVAEAMRQAISEATDASTRTASYVFWRTGQVLDAEHGAGTVALPSRAGLYRLFKVLSAGKHTTGSARTRRSLAARPDGPFSHLQVSAPGEVMEIDSTPLDVLVRLDDGVEGRADLTGMVDVATRTVTAVVLQPASGRHRPPAPRESQTARKTRLFGLIRADAEQGMSFRQLSSRHHVHRRLVRQVLATPAGPAPRKLADRPALITGPIRDVLNALADEPLTCWEIWTKMTDDHESDASYTTVRGYVQARQLGLNPDLVPPAAPGPAR